MLDLFKAAALGDIVQLEQAIKESGLEARDEAGSTALIVAVESNEATVEAVEYLLQCGANPNAQTVPPEPPQIDAATREFMKEQGVELPDMSLVRLPPESVLLAAAKHASLAKIEALVAAGADPKFVNDSGYGVLLYACYGDFGRETSDSEAVFRLLHGAGAPHTPETKHGESVASVLSNHGHFELLKVALELGADANPLEWSPLFYAIAFNDMEQFRVEAAKYKSFEDRDGWERTPFLLAVASGNVEAARWLVDRGSDIHAVGRCGKTALMYAAANDHPAMCRWVIEIGGEVGVPDQFDDRALDVAIESDSVDCARILIEAGADVFRVNKYGLDLMSDVESPKIAGLLIESGLAPSRLGGDVRKKITGSQDDQGLEVSKADFMKHRAQRFGVRNPEKMNNAFWEEMVRTRKTAYQPNTYFEISSFDVEVPTWCFDRFGHSFTPLPDGRYVEIGGEHEDGYDPDFCIYNDVVVHDGKGDFEIYGYPKAVFPPTDFHSTTYLDGKIYVIGCLGYQDDRRYGQTPVYVLDCRDWSIKKAEVTGACPGWIFEHNAKLIDGRFIEVSSGKIGTTEKLDDNLERWALDTVEMRWTKKTA